MALNPNLLQSLPDTLVDMYGLVEIDILSDMARRISTYNYFIPAALHQNQKLRELGLTQNEIIARLSALTGQTQEELVALLSEASAEAIEDDVEYYTRAEVYEPSKVNTEALHAQLNSGLLQTQQSFFNITGTTANTATKQFERALDRAWTQINTGGLDYQTAIKRAIIDLAEQGLGSIEYPSGKIDSLEVAVRRAVVTGVNQTAGKLQEKLADDLDVFLVETTAHGSARPAHAKWQGKVFSRKGRVTIDGVTYEDFVTSTRYGYGDGLKGWNCKHDFHPYIHGTSRTWTDAELKKLEEKKFKYNGKEYTEYEATQKQREIEREIRKQKKVAAALDAAGLDSSEARAKLREAQKAYTDFSEQTGLKKQPARTQIANAKAQRAVNKANKEAAQNSASKPLTNNVNSDKIEMLADINKMITPYEQKVLDMVPKKKGYFDFAAHGSSDFIEYGSRDKQMTARELARIIRHNESYNGEKIRLLSCSTGAKEKGFAQDLANALGVEVEAPTDILFVYPPYGRIKIGIDGSGKMKTFKPYGKE